MSEDLKKLFDVSKVREALHRRLQHERFANAVRRRLKQLDVSLPIDPSGSSIDDAPGIASATRRRTSRKPQPTGKTGLQAEIETAVQDMKASLPPKPWHDTIRFVSFDVPTTALEFWTWIETFANAAEREDETRNRILERHPNMKAHPDTELFMTEMILPFRQFFIAQIILAVLQLSASKRSSSRRGSGDLSASVRAEDEDETSKLEKLVDVAGRSAPTFAGQLHAAHHAADLDDVAVIEGFLPDNQRGLARHIAQQRRNNVCTRYAQYHLHYMESGVGTDDDDWIKMMQPLADAGLAHAQLDVGLCCLAVGRAKEGCQWLERAAKNHQPTAMLELGRYHFGEAMGWNSNKGADGFAAKKTDALQQDVKMALKWLDMVGDVEMWDGNTPSDKAQAKRLLQSVESEAKRLQAYEAAKKVVLANEARTRRWVYYTVAVLFAIGAWAVYCYVMREPLAVGGRSDEALDVDPDAPFVHRHRAPQL